MKMNKKLLATSLSLLVGASVAHGYQMPAVAQNVYASACNAGSVVKESVTTGVTAAKDWSSDQATTASNAVVGFGKTCVSKAQTGAYSVAHKAASVYSSLANTTSVHPKKTLAAAVVAALGLSYLGYYWYSHKNTSDEEVVS